MHWDHERGERAGVGQTASRRYRAARASRNPTPAGTRSTASLIGSENGDAVERVPTGLPLRSHKNSSRNETILTDTDRVKLCATQCAALLLVAAQALASTPKPDPVLQVFPPAIQFDSARARQRLIVQLTQPDGVTRDVTAQTAF